MKPRSLVALATAALASLLLVGARGAAADDTVCNGALAPGPHDNVVVPEGANCEIIGATILGNLTAKPGSGRIEVEGSYIRGNVQGDRFTSFFMGANSSVGGNVQLKSFSEGVKVGNSTIGQNLLVEGGEGIVEGTRNTVFGNLQVYKNEIRGVEDIIRNLVVPMSSGTTCVGTCRSTRTSSTSS